MIYFSKSNRFCNLWLLGGTFVSILSLATFMLSPMIVGAVMGTAGDGIGQLFISIVVGWSGLIVLGFSSLFLLLLSLMIWIS